MTPEELFFHIESVGLERRRFALWLGLFGQQRGFEVFQKIACRLGIAREGPAKNRVSGTR